MTDFTPHADLFRLDGKVALVTGASSGLGDRFARVLHEAGARVVVAARRADRLEALAAELDGIVALPLDVTDDEQVGAVVDEVVSSLGAIDVLVNNAGIGTPMPAEDEPLDHFRQVVEVNLTGLFHVTQRCGRAMLAGGRGGVVVNIASILGLVASAPITQASYAASKGAVVNLTRELAVQWARRGVRVNAIAPGWFPSEMTAEMFDDESSLTFVRRNAPMARAGKPDELDGPLLFLASEASSYVTGHTLVVDGGWTAR